jgi:zinc/manganese transport system ATP-binding protein
MININDITLQVPGKILLQHFSAHIHPGERIGIFGPNGAGKSTLLKALLGMQAIYAGNIAIAKTTTIAYLPQEFDTPTLDYSVIGFLQLLIRGEKYGLPIQKRVDHQRCDTALTEVNALHLKHKLLKQLSGGERKRIMLAGLLLNHPQVLLLDEPLANLDLRYQKEMLSLIDQLQRRLSLTILITAHDFNPLLHLLDRVLFMGEGQAILDTPENVIQDKILSDLYQTPLHVVAINGRKWVLSQEDIFLNAGNHCHGGPCVSV